MSHADSQSTKITRRRFLTVIAATGAAPLIGVQPAYAAGRFHEWSGTALGAEASMRLWHADAALAQQTIAASVVDLDRMENIFSLFRDASQISRLNRHGALVNPAPELVDVLRQAARLSDKSGGSFDVTVQPLWRLFEAHFRRQPNDVVGPSAADIATAVAHIDYRNLTIAAERIGFDQPGMAITLNGIAQGYVTDRIADRLRAAGFGHVIVNLGEIRALGPHPTGRPWQVGIKNPRAPWTIGRTEGIMDLAVATSAGYAHRFGDAPHHHLFDPRTGHSAQEFLDVTVIGPRATQADALATALAVMGALSGKTLMTAFPGYRATATMGDGGLVNLAG